VNRYGNGKSVNGKILIPLTETKTKTKKIRKNGNETETEKNSA